MPYREPAEEELEYRYSFGGPIDPEIEEFIFELVDKGYPTFTSCAGHPDHPQFSVGFLHLDGLLLPKEKREVRRIARKHGLKGVVLSDSEYNTSVSFSPVGCTFEEYKRRGPIGEYQRGPRALEAERLIREYEAGLGE